MAVPEPSPSPLAQPLAAPQLDAPIPALVGLLLTDLDLSAWAAGAVMLFLLLSVVCGLVKLKTLDDYTRLAAQDAETARAGGKTGLYQRRASATYGGYPKSLCRELCRKLSLCWRQCWRTPKAHEAQHHHDQHVHDMAQEMAQDPPYIRMFGPDPKHVPDAMPPHLLLGITADGVREWLHEQQLLTPPPPSTLEGSGGDGSASRIGYDAQAAANRAALADGLSVCERLRVAGSGICSRPLHAHHIGVANVFVCWPLSAPLATLLEALESFIALPTDRTGAFIASGTEQRDRSRIFFWICTFSLRLHSPSGGAPGGGVPPAAVEEVEERSHEHQIYLEASALVIELTEHMLVLLDSWASPNVFGRTHCLREMLLAHERRARVEMVMGDDDRRFFEHAFRRDFDPLRGLLDRIARVDLWKADAFSSADLLYVREEAEEFGYAQGEPNSPQRLAGKGRTAVNLQLHTVMRAALVRFARGTFSRLAAGGTRVASGTVQKLGALVKETDVQRLRESLGDGHPATLSALNQLAGLHMGLGDLPLAERLYRECLKARRDGIGHTEPATVVSMANLGNVLFERGKLEEAGTLMHEALHVRQSTLGALDPATLRSLDTLGRVQRAKGELESAVATATQVLEGRRKILGHYHVDTLKAMIHLASALYDKALRAPADVRKMDVSKAIRLYRDALDMCRAELGDGHDLTVQAMNNLGNLLHARGVIMPKFIAGRGPNKKRDQTLAEAAELLREALEASQRKYGASHIESLIGASNLGSALRTLGGDKMARPGYSTEELASMEREASGLIRTAVEGIVEQVKEPPIETKPRARAELLEGLAELGHEGRQAVEELES